MSCFPLKRACSDCNRFSNNTKLSMLDKQLESSLKVL